MLTRTTPSGPNSNTSSHSLFCALVSNKHPYLFRGMYYRIEVAPSEPIVAHFVSLLHNLSRILPLHHKRDGRNPHRRVGRRGPKHRNIIARIQEVQQDRLQLPLVRGDGLALVSQVAHDGRKRLHSLVIGRREPELILERLRRIEVVSEGLDVLLRRLARVQHGDVRTVHLVPRESVEVDPERLDVDPPVRREAHAVNAKQSTRFVDRIRDGFDVVDPPQDIAHVRARYELDLGAQQRLEILGGKFQLGLRGRPPLDRQVEAIREVDPGLDVRLVLHLGEDDLGALGDLQRRGEVHEELGGGGAEHDLVPARVHVLCGRLVAFFVFCVGDGAGVVGCAELDIGLGQVLGYPGRLLSIVSIQS